MIYIIDNYQIQAVVYNYFIFEKGKMVDTIGENLIVKICEDFFMSNEILRKNIESYLSNCRLTVGGAERLANIGSGSLRNFLLGKTRNLSFDSINALAKVFKCSVSNLIADKAFSSLEKVPWSYSLFIDSISSVNKFISEKNLEIETQEVIILASEIYRFSVESGGEINTAFAEWILKDRLAR